MKHIDILVFLVFTTFNLFSQDKKEMSSEITTYYLIRHAEKDRSNPDEKNPHLNAEGLKRAENWNIILGNIKFDAIYSTDYHRTKETAQPTANTNNLEILVYDPNTVDMTAFKKDTHGKNVLIVGHSNTIPSFVNAIIGKGKYKDMDDADNGILYIVTSMDGIIAEQVLTID